MSAAQAAGTHCALSESCVGTTTQRGSCDLRVLALWLGSALCLGSERCAEFIYSELITGKPEVIGGPSDPVNAPAVTDNRWVAGEKPTYYSEASPFVSRVGGGALTRWPPSAAQTARTHFG
jgi:hypothetical protein